MRRVIHRLLGPLVVSTVVLSCAPKPTPCPRPAPGPARKAARAAQTMRGDPAFLTQFAATYRFRLGWPQNVTPTPSGDAVLFLRSGPRSFAQGLYEYSVAHKRERRLLTAAQVLAGAGEQLTDEERARRERLRIAARGIVSFSLSRDGGRILVPLGGRLFLVERASGSVRELRGEGGFPIDPRLSPDGARVACVRDGDLYLFDVASGRQRRLTWRGKHPPAERGAAVDASGISHGVAEFAAQEEMQRYAGYWWSPDSTRIAFQQTDASAVERLHIGEPANPLRRPRSFRYPRAGTANAAVRLGVISVRGGAVRWVHWDRRRYPYLATVRWSRGGPLTLLVQSREQTEEALLAADERGATRVLPTRVLPTRTLLVERDDAWLNLDQSVPRWLESGAGFLWSSERRGRWQLELRDAAGKLIRPLTAPELGYRQLLHVDEAGGSLIVSAGDDPTETHVVQVPLGPLPGALGGRDPGAPRRLSSGRGEHRAVVSRGHEIMVLDSDLWEGKREFDVRRVKDGAALGALRSVAERPPFSPQVELTTVGARRYRAAIVRPRAFRAGQRYPVILYVYGGPGYCVARASRQRYLLSQWIADHGFVVVYVDGRGTPHRGRAWERAIKGDFAKLPLTDQMAGLEALGARYPELDLGRVGVYGWSFGGYLAAMAVLRHPERFHAAVAGAPVTEWRDYDTHYTERYLGLPAKNRAGYERSSALTYAPELRRPLLLVHGTADDNVYFMHSMKLSDALFRAGRHHEFLPLGGFTHMVPDPVVTRRLYARIVAFFRARL